MNNVLSDSAVGMAAYFATGKNEKAGAFGDIADVAIGFALGASVSKSDDAILHVAQTARKVGQYITAEQKAVSAAAKTSTGAIVINLLMDVAGKLNDAATVKQNAEQME
jgi:hypothetical protein